MYKQNSASFYCTPESAEIWWLNGRFLNSETPEGTREKVQNNIVAS